MVRLKPWIRTYNYMEDYFLLLYKIYAEAYIASYPVTYYAIDLEKSTGDIDIIGAGTYERHGIGPLSGYKFKKIEMFPVYGIEPIRPTMTSDEKGGITYLQNAGTRIVFPSIYGLIPSENDIIDLSFGYHSITPKDKMLYVASAVNIAHQGDGYQLYEITLKPSTVKLENLDKQISEYFIFYEHTKSVIPKSNAIFLLKIITEMSNISSELSNKFNKSSGTYNNII